METTKINLESPDVVAESAKAEGGCCGGSCACSQ